MKKPSKSEVKAALKRNFLFVTLNEQELDDLFDHLWVETLPTGYSVVHEGEPAEELYLIIDGGVNVTKAPGQFLSYLGHDGFFGEMALFSETSIRSATCITAADTVCAVIRKDDLQHYCDKFPKAGIKIYREIIKVLAERLQTTSADLAMLMNSQVKDQTDVSSMVEKAKRIRGKKLED